jgi:hypothetical protein
LGELLKGSDVELKLLASGADSPGGAVAALATAGAEIGSAPAGVPDRRDEGNRSLAGDVDWFGIGGRSADGDVIDESELPPAAATSSIACETAWLINRALSGGVESALNVRTRIIVNPTKSMAAPPRIA